MVTAGVVEPHLYAGFSGGVKGVAIGCAGRETIAWTHRPAFISEPGVSVCRLRGNPFQATLREIAARTPLALGREPGADRGRRGRGARRRPGGRPAGARPRGGAGVAAQRRRALTTPSSPASPRPRATASTRRAGRRPTSASPPVRRSRTAASSCSAPTSRSAPATGPASATSSRCSPPPRRRRSCSRAACASRSAPAGSAPSSSRESWSATASPSSGRRTRAFLAPLAHLGVAAFDSVDAALAAEDARLGRRASVLAVADAMATVVTAA